MLSTAALVVRDLLYNVLVLHVFYDTLLCIRDVQKVLASKIHKFCHNSVHLSDMVLKLRSWWVIPDTPFGYVAQFFPKSGTTLFSAFNILAKAIMVFYLFVQYSIFIYLAMCFTKC